MIIDSFKKSPFNYIGGKFRLLQALFYYFPDKVDTMVDLFAGGGDVFINATANRIIANDINHFVIGIYRALQQMSPTEAVSKIEEIIGHWGLSKTNAEAYNQLRKHYNETHDPLELFTLVTHSFNYQFRFNSQHEYNNPFGKNRSWFNPTMKRNLLHFVNALHGVELSDKNFVDFDYDILRPNDFVYADPPYLITTGSYNDGKRGFEGWDITHEKALLQILDMLNGRNIKFALSNVIEHKGQSNDILKEWMVHYNVYYLNKKYDNSNYHALNTDKPTTEVLITNY